MLDKQTPECPDCDRIHTPSQACPRRVTRAIISAHGLQLLTEQDRAAIRRFDSAPESVESIFEDWLVEELI